MESHDAILAETSQILELSFDRLQQAPKLPGSAPDSLPPKQRDALKQLAADLREERQRNGDLEATVSSLTDQLAEADSENTELRQSLEVMTKELEAVCVSNSEIQRELFKKQRAHTKAEELQASLQEKEAAITEWHSHLQELERKFAKLEEENRTLRAELQQTSTRRQATGREAAELQREVETQGEELRQLRAQLAGSVEDSVVEKMKHDLVNSQEMRARLAEANRRLSAELQQRKDDSAELAQENGRLEADVRALSAKMATLEETVEEMKKEREVLGETIENLQKISEKQSRELLETAWRGGPDPNPRLVEVTTRLNEEMKKRLSDKTAFRTLLLKDKEAFTAKIAEKDAVIANLREQANWTPDIAYRTSEQLAGMTAQLMQEREKRFSAERTVSVSPKQDLRRELYERRVSSVL